MFSTSVLWEFWEKGQFAHDGKTKYYHSVYYVKQLNDKNYIYNEKDQKDFFSESLSMCRLIMVTIQWMVLMLMGQTQATDTCGDPKPKPAVDLLALPPSVFSKASRLPMHSRSPSRSSPWVMRLTGSTDEELIQSSHSAANLPSHCPHKNCRSKIEFWAYCHSFFLCCYQCVSALGVAERDFWPCYAVAYIDIDFMFNWLFISDLSSL